MALQEKVIDCGVRLTVFGMVMRFVVAPVTFAVGSLAVGLRGDALHVAIIQVSIYTSLSSYYKIGHLNLSRNPQKASI